MSYFDFDESAAAIVPTLEVIDFQKNTDFGDALTAELKVLRGAGKLTAKKVEDSQLAPIIKKYTGLSFTFKTFSDENAYVMIPEMRSWHPFFQEWGEMLGGEEGRKALAKKATFDIRVNLKTGMVSGDAADYMHTMGLGLGFYDQDTYLSSEEGAAIIMHEVGHMVTFWTVFGYYAQTNFLLTDFAERVFENKSAEARTIMVKNAEKEGMAVKNAKGIAEATDKNQIKIIIFSDIVAEAQSDLGYNPYDMRACEQQADQFVSRHGYGKYVVTGLDKLYKKYGMRTGSVAGQVFFQLLINIVLIAFSAGFFAVLILLILMLTDQHQEMYDNPRKRFEVLRKDLIARLKGVSDPVAKKRILDNLDEMQGVISLYGKEFRLYAFLQGTFGPVGRGRYRHKTSQQLLEEFANSELNVAAARLETM